MAEPAMEAERGFCSQGGCPQVSVQMGCGVTLQQP